MKKVRIPLAIAGIIALLFSGCAMHQGFLQSSASLDSANFSYVDQQIQGTSTATYILGIGGLNRATLVDEAKQDMIKSHPLKSNQALANTSVNFKISFYVVYFTMECIVTADVVEFE